MYEAKEQLTGVLKAMAKPSHVYLRFKVNQIGITVQASLDNKDWRNADFQSLQKLPYTDSQTGEVKFSTCIETQKSAYVDLINSRGIKTTIVKDAD